MATALDAAVAQWREEGLPSVDVVLVAGSGVGGEFGSVVVEPRPLTSILPFAARGIHGHDLTLEVLERVIDERPRRVLCFRGRLHLYQGFAASQVVFGVRFAALLGAEVAVVTNAAGGLYDGVQAGDLALIEDHINWTGNNPLCGDLPANWGPQFPDMGCAYDPALREMARQHAERLGIQLREAVYVGVLGPSYETPAEIQAFRALGGGLVGMSTVLEVIAAHHMGLRCLGVSLVTNPAAGISEEVLDHEDVLAVGRAAKQSIQTLLGALLSDPDLLQRTSES